MLFRVGVAGRRQARLDGKRRTPVLSAVIAGEGAEPPSRRNHTHLIEETRYVARYYDFELLRIVKL